MVRALVRIALVIYLLSAAACSDNDGGSQAVDHPVATTLATPDPSCWDLVGQRIDQEPNYLCTTGTDTKVAHGFHTITCETGPDLAFVGGQHDPILLYGRVGQEWRRYEGTADFPETSGEPYRTCRPSEPPCRPNVSPESPVTCPGG